MSTSNTFRHSQSFKRVRWCLSRIYKAFQSYLPAQQHTNIIKTKRPRDALDLKAYHAIMKMVTKNSYINSRRRLALTLLYLTGLRVSNLLYVTPRNIYELVSTGRTVIPIIKGGPSRHGIHIGNLGQELLSSRRDDISRITHGKNEGDSLFTAKRKRDGIWKSMHRVNLTRELNRVLVQYSENTGNYVRTHSFRAGLVTDLLEKNIPVYDVREIVGHRNINTTLRYNRNILSENKLKSYMNSRHREGPV